MSDIQESGAAPELPVVFLMGPTASGKTALAMQLYDRLPCEIISVDSAMIYKGMDIGTAKPEPELLARYPHHLVDICDPSEAYSAAEFRRDALKIIHKVRAEGKVPILTGGTMLYFNALKNGLAELPQADPVVRERLLQQATEIGWPAMHARLAEVDPVAAQRLNPNDSQRLQRALEIYEISGKTMTELWSEQQQQQPGFPIVSMAVMPEDRAELHQRIEQRFDLMMEQGFIDEVKMLWDRGDLTLQMPAVRCVGYRQVWEYFSGQWDKETMRFKAIVATRQLAKRQVTWLRSWENLNWIDTHDPKLCANALKLMGTSII